MVAIDVQPLIQELIAAAPSTPDSSRQYVAYIEASETLSHACGWNTPEWDINHYLRAVRQYKRGVSRKIEAVSP